MISAVILKDQDVVHGFTLVAKDKEVVGDNWEHCSKVSSSYIRKHFPHPLYIGNFVVEISYFLKFFFVFQYFAPNLPIF